MRTISLQPSFSVPTPESRVHLPAWKRATDLTCCLLALPGLMLLTLVMTIVTKLVSPGPVIFRQERIGWRGRRFRIFKFRTMHVGADPRRHQRHVRALISSNAPMVKLDERGESRLFAGSWLLRASGLDELPQIINVLRGEMSVVGPRPCLPAEFDDYLPWQRKRCQALPGLTGLWQVSGKNRTTFVEMVRLDIRYAETTSPWLDAKIILRTVPVLLRQIQDARGGKTSPVPSAHTIPPY
jgi:lipopolysaccharide/colanic/teichoic acid biosynthesis glycosyltransferase